MNRKYVLALDQGTSSSRAILFDHEGNARAAESQEFKQYYPYPGWVEHDPEEIWESQCAVVERVMRRAGAEADNIVALGITNQRETVLLWDKETSRPIHPAIVWQCRRTAEVCERIRREGFDFVLREKTGLMTDAYFSGTKIAWLLENVPEARRLAEKGKIVCGTIDTWLAWRLTQGHIHATDCSNASRTLLFNIHTMDWDREILDYFHIPRSILAEVKSSSEIWGEARAPAVLRSVPIAGVAGDQQAALFGQLCLKPGSLKNTYGTGCFLLMNTGDRVVLSEAGLLSTVAWRRNGRVNYALEGSVFIAGAALQWLRDEMGILVSVRESEAVAESVPDNGGVYFVPAFVGLGAPYWDTYARGTIIGLTRGSNRSHLVRAALESIAFQTRAVVDAMSRDHGRSPEFLRVDGGAAQNNFLCQFQADILGIPVERAAHTESTALGAAYLAGLATGFWKSDEEIASFELLRENTRALQRRFEPKLDASRRDELYSCWLRAVERAREWASGKSTAAGPGAK